MAKVSFLLIMENYKYIFSIHNNLTTRNQSASARANCQTFNLYQLLTMNSSRSLSFFLITVALTMSKALAQSSSANYAIKPQVIDAGGGTSSSASYAITKSSVGGIFGCASSANFTTGSGYVKQVETLENLSQEIDLRDYDSWITQFPQIPIADRDRSDDADGDGVSNEEEFLALTDPSDPTSSLKVTLDEVSFSPDRVEVSFFPYEQDATLRVYELLIRTDLSGDFSPTGLMPAPSGVAKGLFTDLRNLPLRLFYRVKISIPQE